MCITQLGKQKPKMLRLWMVQEVFQLWIDLFFKHFLRGCVWSSLLGCHRPEAPHSFPKALLHQSNNGLGENIIIQCKNFKKTPSKHGNLFPLFCNSHGVHYVTPSFLENKVQKLREILGLIHSPRIVVSRYDVPVCWFEQMPSSRVRHKHVPLKRVAEAQLLTVYMKYRHCK